MKAKRGKCLALVAVLAMVVCAFAIALPAGGSDAADVDFTEVNNSSDLNTAINEGKSVKLTANITGDVVIPAETTITIDLAGFKITNGSIHTIINNGTLTVIDSSEGKTGTVDNVTHGRAALYNNGTATLNGGTFDRSNEAGKSASDNGGNSWYTVYNDGIMTINDGTTVQNKGGYSSNLVNGHAKAATLTINGGTFTGGINSVKNDEFGTAIVNDGTFSNTSQATFMNWNVAAINGGTFDCEYENFVNGTWTEAGKTTKGELNINGGNYTNKTGLVTIYYNADYVSGVLGFGKITIDASIKGSVFAPANAALTGEVSFGSNKAVFDGMKAGTDGVTLSAGSIAIEGNFEVDSTGSITVTGSAKITGDVTIPAGATLTVSDGATLTGNGKIINNGTVDIAGTADVTIENNANANVVIQPGSTVDTTKITGTGAVSGGSNWEIVEISGVLKAEFTGDVNQTVIVTGDLEIRSNMTINGKLVVNEGATVTIATAGAGITFGTLATAEINGDLVLETTNAFVFDGTSMTVNGNIDVEAADALNISKATTVNGSVNVTEDGSAALSETTISSTGSITVNGKVTGTIVDFGTVTVDSDNTETDLTIQVRNAAIVSITKTAGTITVTDDGMTYKTGGRDTEMTHNNTIVFTKVSGVSVTEKMVVVNNADGTRSAYGVMTIDGNIDATNDSDGTAYSDAKVEVKKGILTAGEMTVGKVGFVVDADAEMSIATTVVFNDSECTVTGSGTVTITGTLATVKKIEGVKINAASYVAKVEKVDYNYYTTFEAAVESGSTAITTYGAIEVSKTIDVPAGVVVTMSDGSSMTVKADVTLKFVDGSKFKDMKTVDVKGTLVIENFLKSGAVDTKITSDVEKKSGNDKVYTMTYTNIYDALSGAVDGEIVKLRADGVKIEKNVSVPAGVTFQIDKTLELKGATMTVEGKVVVENEFTISDDGDKIGAVVVNGLFQYKTGTYSDKIAGAYFAYNGVDTIAPIAFAAENIDTIDSDVRLYLVNETTDIAFNYTGTNIVNLKVFGTLKAGTVTLKNVVFDAVEATDVTATIALTNGSVSLTDVKGMKFEDKVVYDADNNPVYTANFSGTIAKCDDTKVKSGAISFNGEVVATGSVGVNVNVTVPAGITLTADGFSVDYSIVVEGTFHATENSTIATATVFGSMTTADGKEITITKLYLGIDASKIITTGASASVSDAVDLAPNGTAFVAPGCDAGKEITSYGKTEFYVEGNIYITGYVNGTSDLEINEVKATVDNAEFKGWQADGTDVPAGKTIGSDGYAKVEAKLDYNICEIKVTVVPGAVVYIDGDKFDAAKNMYTVGNHTVEVYLESGYSGTPVVNVNGTEISGKTFTTSADKVTEISVTGIAAYQPSTVEPENDDGMSLTDILLIVLVVLIAVMAIMVALRMMRS